jgi:arginase
MGWIPEIVHVHQVFRPTPEGTKLYQPLCVAETCNKIAEANLAAASKGHFPLMIGGDHCLAMGSIAASKKRYPNLCVIWFDAHADVNTEETSPSGNMHGMPISALLGLNAMKNAPGFSEGQFTCLQPGDVGWIGLRDVDEGEYETLEALGMRDAAFHMEDLAKMGIREQLKQVLDRINPNRDRPIHLSFDVDGMDPIDAPSTGTAVPNGVRLHEAIEMVRALRDTGLLVSMDLVEVNPSLGDECDVEVTIRNARWILFEGLGLNVK